MANRPSVHLKKTREELKLYYHFCPYLPQGSYRAKSTGTQSNASWRHCDPRGCEEANDDSCDGGDRPERPRIGASIISQRRGGTCPGAQCRQGRCAAPALPSLASGGGQGGG